MYPDIHIDSATATNTCGLEVSATKICGDITKHKCFTISGSINVDEHDTVTGCEGSRDCSDGRFTATKQHLTQLGDVDFCPEFGHLCKEAANNVDEATECDHHY